MCRSFKELWPRGLSFASPFQSGSVTELRQPAANVLAMTVNGRRPTSHGPALVGIVVAVITGLTLALWKTDRQAHAPLTEDTHLSSDEAGAVGIFGSSLPQVQRVRWNGSDASLAQYLLAIRVPVVLSDTVVDQWRARRRWTPKYLASRIATLDGVYESRGTRMFGPFFDEARPMAQVGICGRRFLGNMASCVLHVACCVLHIAATLGQNAHELPRDFDGNWLVLCTRAARLRPLLLLQRRDRAPWIGAHR
jgi:hypothetical protein